MKKGDIVDFELTKSLETCKIFKSAKELEDVMAYEGKDIVVFFYTSAYDSEMQRTIVANYDRLAKVFKQKRISSVVFYGYDFNTLGDTDWALTQELPNLQFSPAYQRD